MREIEGELRGEGRTISIIVSRFNSFITEKLLEGALDQLTRHGVSEDNITIVRVPGAFEIPMVAKRLAKSRSYSAVICLAAVIRGGTPHFEYVSAEVTKGIAQVSLEFGVPVVYGVITADTIEQAIERAGTKMGNKGGDAAQTALEMASLLERLPVSQ